MFRKFFLPLLVFIIYRLLSWSWRIKIIEPEEMKRSLVDNIPFILAHWHGDELCLIHLTKTYKIATITSQSKDGELMTRVVHWLGGATSRGSSSRGGASALKGLIRLFKQGYTTSFAVDGPKGPYHRVKPGIFEMSRLLKSPIYVAGVATNSAWHFPKAWNKTFLPKPFAKVVIYWVGPISEIEKDQDPRCPQLAKSLEMKFNEAQLLAQQEIAAKL